MKTVRKLIICFIDTDFLKVISKYKLLLKSDWLLVCILRRWRQWNWDWTWNQRPIWKEGSYECWTQGVPRNSGHPWDMVMAGGHVRVRHPNVTALSDGRRNWNASSLASIIPPGVGADGYLGVVCRGMGGETEQGSGINKGDTIYCGGS